MPTILAFDTATEALSVALIQGESVIDEVVDAEPNRHTEKLIAVVDAMLAKHALALASVVAIAVGAGPGAVTGLRVACGVAQGMGWAAGKPLLAASNLEATARHAANLGFRGRLLVAHDARMHECYMAVFEVEGDREGEVSVHQLAAPELVKPVMIAEAARTHAVEAAAGSAFAAYAEDIKLPEGTTVLEPFATTAADIARVGLALYIAGRTTRAEEAAPLYVRNRVALTIEERRAGEKL